MTEWNHDKCSSMQGFVVCLVKVDGWNDFYDLELDVNVTWGDLEEEGCWLEDQYWVAIEHMDMRGKEGRMERG